MPNSSRVKVVLVEDSPRYRETLSTFLRLADGFELVGVFSAADTFLKELRTGRLDDPPFDLVLMDIEMPRLSGIEATRRLKAERPNLHVVMITVFEDPAVILEAITAGADGYLLKRASAKQLLTQLTLVAEGGAPLTAGVASTVLDLLRRCAGPNNGADPSVPANFGLSEREQETLRGLVDGLTYQGVADRMGISVNTVRNHVRSVYKKLQVHSVAEAVRIAMDKHLF